MLNFVQQIESVACRIQRRRRATAVCWAFAAVVAAMVCLIAADWLFGVYHVVGRVILTAILVAVLAVAYRRGRAATRKQTTSLEVALELERLYPQHRGLLASGLEFSRQAGDDPMAGSLDLRRAAVLRASLAAEAIDLRAATPRQPLRRAAIAAMAALLVLFVPAAVVPTSFATGVVRLLVPFGDAEWPRRHDLAFVDPPELVPIGGAFKTTLRDRRGTLPDEVEVEFRTRRRGRWQYESQVYAAEGDSIEVHRSNVQQPLEYRARGGDHESMPWRQVETAPAPQIESLKVIAHPPAYTRLAAEVVQEPVRIVAGTTLSLEGATSLPIATAALQTAGQPATPLRVARGGESFATPPGGWQPAESADWSIRLTTPQGMTAVADRRLQIEVAADRPPTVQIVAPTEDLVVLPEAKIELAIAADDDLAVKRVDLGLRRDNAENERETRLELYRGGDRPVPGTQAIAYTLDLAALDLAVGTTGQVRAYAADYAGQQAAGDRRLRLRVISHDEFRRRVNMFTTRIASAVERARRAQHEARDRVDELLSPAMALDGRAVLAATSLQRRVGQTIAGSRASAIQLLETLAEEYRRNQWPDDRSIAQVDANLAALKSLTADQLSQAESQLTALSRAMQRSSSVDDDAKLLARRKQLSAVRAQQDETLAILDAMIRELAARREVQEHQRDLAGLKDEQSDLHRETQELARKALRKPSDPSAEQQRARQEAAGRQRELAARLARALSEMRRDATAGDAEPPRIQSSARDAADELAAGRFGRAARSQQEALEQLEQMLSRMTEDGDARERLAASKGADQAAEKAGREGGKSGMNSGENAAAAPTVGTAPVDRSAVEGLVKDLWGRLPQRQREELLQPLSEEFLPEYADEIEEYFRVLAETPPENMP